MEPLSDQEIEKAVSDALIITVFIRNQLKRVAQASQRDTSRQIVEWGNEDCPHFTVMYGGFPPKKHECKLCWQELEVNK